MQDRTADQDIKRAIVVCPLEFERQALRRLGLSAACDLHCCGPGPAAAGQWARSIGATNLPVILAGLAGALDPAFGAGAAYRISRVLLSGGGSIDARHLANERGLVADCMLVSTNAPVTSIEKKRTMFNRTGAALVDMESEAFVWAARELNWTWAIVRGVSDDASTSLPDHIDQWVNAQGKARHIVIARMLLQRPFLMRSVVRLNRNGRKAMKNAAALIEEMIAPSNPTA